MDMSNEVKTLDHAIYYNFFTLLFFLLNIITCILIDIDLES